MPKLEKFRLLKERKCDFAIPFFMAFILNLCVPSGVAKPCIGLYSLTNDFEVLLSILYFIIIFLRALWHPKKSIIGPLGGPRCQILMSPLIYVHSIRPHFSFN